MASAIYRLGPGTMNRGRHKWGPYRIQIIFLNRMIASPRLPHLWGKGATAISGLNI